MRKTFQDWSFRPHIGAHFPAKVSCGSVSRVTSTEMEFSMSLDPAVAELQREIEQARAALVSKLRENPDHLWSPRELKAESKSSEWSYGAANLALTTLVEDGRLVIDDDGVHLNAAAA